MKRAFLIRAALLLALALLPATAQADRLKVIRDEEIEQSLKTISKPIWDEAGLSSSVVRVILIEDSTLNAFVAGGQNIFFHTGLLLDTDSVDELAGVIAHESGHIASGHIARMNATMEEMSLQTMLAQVLGIAVAIGAGAPDAGMAAASLSSSVALRGILRHSRIQESAADQSGVRFLEAANLPVAGFASFMDKLASQELLPDSQQSEYVRTHPLSQDRVDFLRNAAAQYTGGSVPAQWVALHKRMKAKLEGYLYPDRALLRKGDDSDTRYARAIAWYRKGQAAKSLEALNGLIKEEPNNPYFQEQKGQLLFELGRVAEAIPAYAQAVKFAPSSGLIGAAYGHALLENKQVEQAIPVLEKSLQTEPKSSRTHHLLGIAYGKLGKEGRSRLHLAEEALLQDKPDYAKTEANLALQKLPKGATGRLRAQDILDAAERRRKEKKKQDNK